MKFFKYMQNFVDAQIVYGRIMEQRSQIGLSTVAKEILGVKVCKGEQMSNWEARPLRLS